MSQLPHFENLSVPHQINEYRREKMNLNYYLIVEKVVSTLIDEPTLIRIEKYITLSLYDLLIPTENISGKVPRPQNSYIIYRRNYQARLALSDEPNATLNKISKITSSNWKNESLDTKKIFDILAECAKKVHKCIFPNYVYNPKRHATIKSPMTSKNKIFWQDPLGTQFLSKQSFRTTRDFRTPLSSPSPQYPLTNQVQDSSSSSLSLSKPLLTFEISQDLLKSFDKDICKKFDINL
ncbi:unnamed protein product [Rhizophagus irregularis]|uniref:MATA-HMG n=1 Tax=Rhizophagus irregularis TaxID=588596 RepID=A0A1B1ETR6_9GLOM|nr:MATA-HMG [Rhizophagus irregularis]CAB4384940.1 unnamed protein product [Rhizophagus irregularis]CAB5311589.1 unnamed protein product [Rhizophagus irregularis]